MLEEQLAETIGSLVEFLIGNDLGRRSHDDGRLVWGGGCDLSRKHSQKLAHILKPQAIWDKELTGPIKRKVAGVTRFVVSKKLKKERICRQIKCRRRWTSRSLTMR